MSSRLRVSEEVDELLTTQEVAELLKVRPKTLENWRYEGPKNPGPPFIRLGTGPRARIRYRRSDVQAWMKAAA